MNTVTRTTTAGDGMWARGLNGILGLWLIISAYVWPHTAAQVTNDWIVGILAIVFSGIAAYSAPKARFANTALAVWLFFSAFVVVTINTGTVWNNVIVGVLMFLFSLVPNQGRGGRPVMRATT